MQCACPQCGALMVHSTHHNRPACVCPQCTGTCQLCLGNRTRPLTRETLRDGVSLHMLLHQRDKFDQQVNDMEQSPIEPDDQRRYKP